MSHEDRLPDSIRSLFWDCDPSEVSITAHRSFIIGRVLDSGDWNAVSWLRREVGDDALREWFVRKRGGGLDARKMRFWELILGLPGEMVSEWVSRSRV
jgi:hypothetical protein